MSNKNILNPSLQTSLSSLYHGSKTQCIYWYINYIYHYHHQHTSLGQKNNDTIPNTSTFQGDMFPLEHLSIMWMEIFNCVKCNHWTDQLCQIHHIQLHHTTDCIDCIGCASQPITRGINSLTGCNKNYTVEIVIVFLELDTKSNQMEESFEDVSTVLISG